MQNASMTGASPPYATRGSVASATDDTSGIATCTGALAMQSEVAGQLGATSLGSAFSVLCQLSAFSEGSFWTIENASSVGDLG